MEKKIHTYESEDITVEFDSKRCIHSAECVKGLNSVFNPNEQPWVKPENASADNIKEIVHHCPTGALHYKDADSEEKPSRRNSITIAPDGPLYLRGDIEIQNADGETILEDTRVALCRCGVSENKPLCDNSHKEADFEAPAGFDESKLRPTNDGESDSKLVLRLMDNGPILVNGEYDIYSLGNQPASSTKNIAFCRCGRSGSKPFCDGTHKEVGFES